MRFTVEEGGEGEAEELDNRAQRLHRRDTPHHLKNKRVNQAVDKERVATIIAAALQGRPGEEEQDGEEAKGTDGLPAVPPRPHSAR